MNLINMIRKAAKARRVHKHEMLQLQEHVVSVFPTQGWICTCGQGGDPATEETSVDLATLHLMDMGLLPEVFRQQIKRQGPQA